MVQLQLFITITVTITVTVLVTVVLIILKNKLIRSTHSGIEIYKVYYVSHLEQQPRYLYWTASAMRQLLLAGIAHDPRLSPGGMVRWVMCCVVPGHASPAARLHPRPR